MKFSSPPFILAHAADSSGCGHHRIIRPCEILSRSGYCAARIETNFLIDSVLQAIAPTAVIWQRQSEDGQIAEMKRYRAALPSAFFVYELDDALSAVPLKSWHRPYMTPNIDEKTAAAIALCDVVTVTTHDLADHMRKFCRPGTRFRIIPNMLGKDDVEIAQAILQQPSQLPPTTKLRVGWGGGIGHIGDIAMISEIFPALSDRVQFVFLGMDPAVPSGTDKLFAGAVPPHQYLQALAHLHLDLMIAPLEENLFNRCKSNLRLIEGGACSYATIASPVSPYFTDSPPLFAQPETPDEWLKAIEKFIVLPESKRKQHGANMFSWMRSRYIMDDHIEKRLLGWLPEHTKLFKPRLNVSGSNLIVACSSSLSTPFPNFESTQDLEAACADSTADVLYIRPGTQITAEIISRIHNLNGDVLAPLCNDAGPWGFPSPQQFTALDALTISALDAICEKHFSSLPAIDLAAVTGPCVLLRRSALAAIGSPDFAAFPNAPELAILEWSAMARARGLKIGLAPRIFVGVSQPAPLTQQLIEQCALRIGNRWPQGKNDDEKLRALREQLELHFHREHFTQLPPSNRTDYAAWVDSCDTRGPRMIEAAQSWLAQQSSAPAIALHSYPLQLTHETLGSVEWLFFAPQHAILQRDITSLLTDFIHAHPSCRFVYADHDHLSSGGTRLAPDFKPNLDLIMLLARDYVSQACAIHVSVLKKLLLENRTITLDEAELFDIALYVVDEHGRDAIAHLPRIAASIPLQRREDVEKLSERKLRSVRGFLSGSDNCTSLEDHLTVVRNPQFPHLRDLTFHINNHAEPLVSIILPTKNNIEMLAPCIESILTFTTYKNYEILVADNGTTRQIHFDYLASLPLRDSRIRVIRIPQDSFNWSSLNNNAVDYLRDHEILGDYLLFLNDDTRVMAPTWLSEMVGAAQLPDVGSVGARLVYPNGILQHIGVVVNNGITGHLCKGLPATNPAPNFFAAISHETTVNTGACLLVPTSIFEEIGGFDERLAKNFNDVVFGLELRKRGYINILANHAELQHLEGVTRNPHGFNNEAQEILHRDGVLLGEIIAIEPDPYWNQNLLVTAFQGGTMIAGMDMQTYNFPADPLPWAKDVKPEHLLIYGDSSAIAPEIYDSAVTYKLEVSGNIARISSPPMQNCGPWDIRKPEIFTSFVAELGIDRIIITTLSDAPLQLLGFLRNLNLPVEYRPTNAEAICPRGDLTRDGANCGKGYSTPNACQSCVDKYSSPHGNIAMPAWIAEWWRFFNAENVSVDLSAVQEEEFKAALEFGYRYSMENTQSG